ncbi:alpha/beta hydrolase [Scytonema tolypothrichoides VB-61278]|nr:alpha/beta hydrolase [Scytonema tolypothrichoides VB-61278]
MPVSESVMREIADLRGVYLPLVSILKGEPADQTIDEARAAYIKVKARQAPPPDVVFEPVGMGGVPGLLAIPASAHEGRILFYIHGGGYVSGGAEASKAEVGRLAKALGARAYVPDYRLAPENPYPVPIDDVLAAYRWLLDQGHEASSIVFAGESAGGAMVISIMVRARNAGLPLPARGLTISPWANLEHTGASMTNRDGIDPVVTKDTLRLLAKAFLRDTLPGDPDASPVFADVRGLPPIMVQVGENEVMMSDAIRLAEHLSNNRVRTTLEVWPGMFHVWHHFAAILSDGQEAIETAAAFLFRAYA